MNPVCITLGSVGQGRGIVPLGGEGDIAYMLMKLSLHQIKTLSESEYSRDVKKACPQSGKEILRILNTLRYEVMHK